MPIPLEYDTAIQKHLRPGEQLLWVGHPRQGWAFRWHNRLLIVQFALAAAMLWWLIKVISWCAYLAGIDLGFSRERPTVSMMSLFAFGGAITIWQLAQDKRRRAGTWYAVTNSRVLFVLTTVKPESVIGVEFNDIADVLAGERVDGPGPARDTVTLKLKRIDPYLANSPLFGYLMSPMVVVLENVPDARELCDLIQQQRRSTAG